jgi:hypothetical protein
MKLTLRPEARLANAAPKLLERLKAYVDEANDERGNFGQDIVDPRRLMQDEALIRYIETGEGEP